MSTLKIIVCCHKKDIYKESDIYMPIHVGKAISNVDLGIPGDDTGDNISAKNASYCELTGMYWAWKNLKGVDYIGLCHYRRYFDFMHNGRRFFPLTTFKTRDFAKLDFTISKKALNVLEGGGCIIAKPDHLDTSLFRHYCEGHIKEDIMKLGDVIKETQPDKYMKAFWDYLIRDNRFSPCNMFIMNWQQFDRYCSWLFPLLNNLEQRIDISHYTTYQKRVFGYLAERLLNMYVRAEKLQLLTLPIMKIADDKEIDNMSSCKYLGRVMVRNIAFSMIKHTL